MSHTDPPLSDPAAGTAAPRRLRSRRRPLLLAAGAAAVAVAVAAAVLYARGGQTQESAAGDTEGPVSGGTLVYGIAGTQVTLDPAVAATAVTGLIDRNIFDSLVAQTGPDEFEPWLAESWDVSEDGTVYTFTLREGVVFHDGTPLDAEAVKRSLDHVVDPDTQSAYAASLIGPYAGSRVVDELTVEVELERPFTPFLQALSVPYLGIQSPQALDRPAEEYEPVGTGPFSFVSWEQDSRVTLARNPDHSSPRPDAANDGPAHLEELVFEFVQEDATRYGALTSGEVHGIAGVPTLNADEVEAAEGFVLTVQHTPGLNYNLYLNQTGGPLADVTVRRALAASIDVDQLVGSVYKGHYPVADNPLSELTAGYDPQASGAATGYDPEEAGRLLDEAGWDEVDDEGFRTRDGERLSLVWPYWAEGTRDQREVLAEGIQAQAAEVGIEIQRPTVDTGTFVDEHLIGGGYDLVDVSFARPTPDVLRFAFHSENTYANAGGNVALLTEDDIDSWVTEAAATADPEEAAELYSLVQHKVLEEAYIVPLYTPVNLTGFSTDVQGLAFDEQTYPVFHDAWLSEE
ncbi:MULTISPECIES: ABC transporter substrate-binding protein [unclassified Nocardiopsis]|uniref:ABC transporter substrate-binding protein n=1 Tax=Nocardiopsis TaxID=2013 RepID=UPI00387B458B